MRASKKHQTDPSMLLPFEQSIFNKPIDLRLGDIHLRYDWLTWTAVEGVDKDIKRDSTGELEEENMLLRSELSKKQQQLDMAMKVAAVARADMKRLESTIAKAGKEGTKLNLDPSIPFIDKSTPDGNSLAGRMGKR